VRLLSYTSTVAVERIIKKIIKHVGMIREERELNECRERGGKW